MKNIVTIFLFCCIPFIGYAQSSIEDNAEIRNSLDQMFEHLDKWNLMRGTEKDTVQFHKGIESQLLMTAAFMS